MFSGLWICGMYANVGVSARRFVGFRRRAVVVRFLRDVGACLLLAVGLVLIWLHLEWVRFRRFMGWL